MTTALVTMPDGRKAQVTFETPDQLDAVVNDFAAHQPEQKEKSLYEHALPHTAMGEVADTIGEPMLHIASGMAAMPIAGLAGLATGGNGDVVNRVQNALTYEPRSAGGKAVTSAVTYPFRKLAEGADYVGEKAADLTGSPAIGAAVNTAIQAVPALLMRGRGAKAQVGDEAVTAFKANENAKEYVNNRTDSSWDAIPQATREVLRQIGVDASNFDNLSATEAQRQIQLASLPKPIENASRGQLSRDPLQLQREEMLKSTEAGQPLREGAVQQNRTLVENLDFLKGKQQQSALSTGGKATDMDSTGASIQGAARAKEALSERNYNALYKKARETEPDATVSADNLYTLLERNPEIQHLGFVQSWLNRAKIKGGEPGTPASSIVDASGKPMVEGTPKSDRAVTLLELDDLRKKAAGIARGGGDNAYYAGEVVRTINEAFDQIPEGAKAWTEARNAFKAHKLEFEEQGGVNKLVDDKSRMDRATALEDTWKKTVISGSLEDLQKTQRSLLTGGDAGTRTLGRIAWRDIKGQTIEYIKQEATKGVSNQAGELNMTYAGLKRAIDKVGEKKLKLILGEKDATTVRNVLKAAETLKTEPAGTGVRGSNTVNKILNILDKSLITKIPGLGPTVEGVVRAGAKVSELGKGGREARAAQETPLSQAAKAAQTQQQRNAFSQQLNKAAPLPVLSAEQQRNYFNR
jgi:hypothetical protein